jgi:AAA domain, putative AbiEii toxin, Type IV TA system
MTFSDGTKITLDPSDIVIFVGHNNAGKSAALRELEEYIGPQIPRTVIRSVVLRRTGTIEQVREFLDLNTRKQGDPKDFQLAGFRFSVATSQIEYAWRNDLTLFRGLFCLRIPNETRITDSNPANAIAVLDSQPSHPIHLLFNDERIEQRLSGYFRRAFNEDLILFRSGGASWPLLVGKRLIPQAGEDRISFTYVKRPRDATVSLQSQGDGMRSFASVVLHLLTPDTPSIFLLDEQEAFLHPPQVRLLGEFIAKERSANSQLFIATHSPDVLQGLLNVAPEHLRVVRIQRDGSFNRVKELDKARAKEIGNDPLMKFTAVMSGLFHQRVVICEADADCMF